jgi:hypothetical protein
MAAGRVPRGAPRHGYVPLMAVMPGKAADIENLVYADEPPAPRTPRPPRMRRTAMGSLTARRMYVRARD